MSQSSNSDPQSSSSSSMEEGPDSDAGPVEKVAKKTPVKRQLVIQRLKTKERRVLVIHPRSRDDDQAILINKITGTPYTPDPDGPGPSLKNLTYCVRLCGPRGTPMWNIYLQLEGRVKNPTIKELISVYKDDCVDVTYEKTRVIKGKEVPYYHPSFVAYVNNKDKKLKTAKKTSRVGGIKTAHKKKKGKGSKRPRATKSGATTDTSSSKKKKKRKTSKKSKKPGK